MLLPRWHLLWSWTTSVKFIVSMKTMLFIFSLLLITGFGAPAVSAQAYNHSGPRVRNKNGTSSNWSGYAAYGVNNSFNNVSAGWNQPPLSCSTTKTYSSYWVGLDGYNNSTVEQLGTEGDCSGGSASYYAWYEMYPKRSYFINISIRPGDTINASVTYVGSQKYKLSITDVTRNESFSTIQRSSSAQRASAEVIVEAPYSGGVLPLANFGMASFLSSLANGLPLGGYSNKDAITMQNPYGMTATPSPFDNTNENFSVTWAAQ